MDWLKKLKRRWAFAVRQQVRWWLTLWTGR